MEQQWSKLLKENEESGSALFSKIDVNFAYMVRKSLED